MTISMSFGTAHIGSVTNIDTMNGDINIHQGDNKYGYLQEHPKVALSRIAEEADSMSVEDVEVFAEALQDSNDEELQACGTELLVVKDDAEKRANIIKRVGDVLKDVNEGFKLGENIAKYGPALITLLQVIGFLK